jgi:CRISPR system Cascade subunit CasA
MHQMPAGTAVAHYHHGVAEEQTFCPICAARGLLTIPAFATSGGAGIKPSINGVPPIYVLPGGTSLFESLVASLVLPDYQPSAASTTRDDVWWRREPVVERKATVHEVGYLHSLTFPARRVRLHPQSMHEPCSRCGRQAPWGVQSMIYRMGESRPKDAPFWFDPFAAYRLRGRKGPVPIRPREGKALWREFAALFLPSPLEEGKGTQPPSALYQRAELAAEADIGPSYAGLFPYRCVGMRTDMKAKIFEWIDANFEVPAALVNDIIGSDEIRQGLTFAEDCARLIGRTFRRTFGGEGQTEHHETLRHRLIDAYWAALADAFRDFVLHVATSDDRQQARVAWIDRVVAEGKRAFKEASEVVGDDADALRKRVTGRRICAAQLNKKRKEVLGEDIA